MYQSLEKGSECLAENFSSKNVTKCLEYVYDQTYYEETIATKFNLVCDKEYLKNILRTLLILGLLFGSLIGGRIGDQIGRKKAAFLAYLVMAPTLIINGFVNSFEAYATLHFIYSCTSPIVWINGLVYLTEFYSPSWRYAFTAAISIPIGAWTLNLIAYLSHTYTMIHMCAGIIAACLLPIYFFVPESPRWLAQNKREKEALKIILDMAETNSRPITDVAQRDIENIVQGIANEDIKKTLNLLDLFKHGQWKKTVILSFMWIGLCVSYYGLSLNATDLSGDIFTNFALSRLTTVFQMPLILGTSIYFGLKWSIACIQILLGTFLIMLAFIPKENTTGVLIVYLTALLFSGASKI